MSEIINHSIVTHSWCNIVSRNPGCIILSLEHHSENFALKSLKKIEHDGWSLLIILIREFKSKQNVSISSWFWIKFYSTRNEVFIKSFFSKRDQIPRKLRIWSHLLKKFLTENLIFCALTHVRPYAWILSLKQ